MMRKNAEPSSPRKMKLTRALTRRTSAADKPRITRFRENSNGRASGAPEKFVNYSGGLSKAAPARPVAMARPPAMLPACAGILAATSPMLLNCPSACSGSAFAAAGTALNFKRTCLSTSRFGSGRCKGGRTLRTGKKRGSGEFERVRL